MAPGRPPSVDGEADRLEAALKAARIPEKLQDGLWDVWVDDPARAHHLIARFKEYPQAMRLKAGTPRDMAYQQLCAASDAGDEPARQAALQQLEMLTRPATGAVSAHLSDAQKAPVATKSATLPSPWRAAIRDDKGNRLP